MADGDSTDRGWYGVLKISLEFAGVLVAALAAIFAWQAASLAQETSNDLKGIEEGRRAEEVFEQKLTDIVTEFYASGCSHRTEMMDFPLDRHYENYDSADPQAIERLCMVEQVGLTYVMRNLTVIGSPQSPRPLVLVDISILDKPGGTETNRSAVEMTFVKVKGPMDYKVKSIAETRFVVEAPAA